MDHASVLVSFGFEALKVLDGAALLSEDLAGVLCEVRVAFVIFEDLAHF